MTTCSSTVVSRLILVIIISFAVVLSFRLREEFNLIHPTPKTLTPLPSINHGMNNHTFSLDTVHQNDTLILSTGNNVKTYDFKEKVFRSYVDGSGKNIQSLAFHKESRKIYFLVGSQLKEMSLETLQNGRNLRTMSCSHTPSRIAVNDEYVLCSNANGYMLMSLNLSTGSQKYHTPPQLKNWIRNLKFHPDGDIVILDYNNKISKYKFREEGNLALVWECTEVPTPYAICVDKERGLVYVTGSGQMLYSIVDGKTKAAICTWVMANNEIKIGNVSVWWDPKAKDKIRKPQQK